MIIQKFNRFKIIKGFRSKSFKINIYRKIYKNKKMNKMNMMNKMIKPLKRIYNLKCI